ncbi:Cytochrome c-type biogenesis protein ResA [Oxalobacteraceae bacterium IMCC9480]|nr:Cytochrome c-type biogenesis protein ResA [Oxalobacteraceae bacterium IMCC9480]NDP59243.1 TlpA family protein disulfide reductase [Oxalobacteraceae bacterium]
MQASTPSTSRKSLYLKLLGLAVVIVLGVIGTLSMSSSKSAPDVTFTDLQGKQIALSSLRGKVVMVNFWATSCTTCVKEMPQMVETYERYNARGLDFVAVAMSYDPPNYVLNFTETRKLPFTVALDPQDKLAKAFGDVKLTPTTFLIDKQGKIIKRYVGEPDFAALHQLLETALAG